MKTTLLRESEITRRWYVVDASGVPAGRLASGVARVLRGKGKPAYSPHMDMGDFVVVVNAEKVRLTGTKEDGKIYKHYTGYPSGLREYPASTVRRRDPTRIIRQAVRGMMPKNNLNRGLFKRLKVYVGPEHPHAAQQPEPLAAQELL